MRQYGQFTENDHIAICAMKHAGEKNETNMLPGQL